MKTVKMTELQKQMALVGAFAVLLFGLGVWLIIFPAIEKSARLQRETSQTGQKQELLKQIQNSEARIQVLQTNLLPEKDRHLILSHVSTLATGSGLELESVNPVSTEGNEKGAYPAFLVKMEAKGPFEKVINLLGSLSQKKPKLAIMSLELSQGLGGRRVNPETGGLSVSITAKTLLSKSSNAEISGQGVA